MTSDRTTGGFLPAHLDTSDDCACGQSLDCCTRAHCPRCGEHVVRRAA